MANYGPRWQWGVKPEDQPNKRPRTCKFLDEMLLDFPDPKSLHRHTDSSASSKQEDTVACLNDRHKEQRRRLLERHTQEYAKWSEENERCIDVENTFTRRYSHTLINSGFMKGTFDLMSTPEAKEALKRLPASKRTVIVCKDQLNPPSNDTLSERDKENMKSLTSVEFAGQMAHMGIEERRRMVSEEHEMRLFQEGSKELFYSAMLRTNPEKYRKIAQLAQTRPEEVRHKLPQRPPAPAPPAASAALPPQGRLGSIKDAPAARSRDPRLQHNLPPRPQSNVPAATSSLTLGGNVHIAGLSRDTRPPPDPRLQQNSPRFPSNSGS